MQKIVIYTDGACSGNPGPGGWGVVILYNGSKETISGYVECATNNIMELSAAIHGIDYISHKYTYDMIEIFTDSKYVKDGISTWIHGWQRNGWKTADKKPVKNMELWQKLLSLTQTKEITWQWVKGHSNNIMNNLADQLARKEIELKKG